MRNTVPKQKKISKCVLTMAKTEKINPKNVGA